MESQADQTSQASVISTDMLHNIILTLRGLVEQAFKEGCRTDMGTSALQPSVDDEWKDSEAFKALAALTSAIGEHPQIAALTNALDIAWTLIANTGGGDWGKESEEWQKAAAAWRDEQYHKLMPKSPNAAIDPA